MTISKCSVRDMLLKVRQEIRDAKSSAAKKVAHVGWIEIEHWLACFRMDRHEWMFLADTPNCISV